MNGRQLVVQWIAGFVVILVLGIGWSDRMILRMEQFIPGAAARRQGVEAARRDSIAAKMLADRRAAADSARPTAPESARAVRPAAASPANSPAVEFESDSSAVADAPASEGELRIARWLILIGIPVALGWNTWRWWRARARVDGGVATG